jgi:hypothetical protein
MTPYRGKPKTPKRPPPSSSREEELISSFTWGDRLKRMLGAAVLLSMLMLSASIIFGQDSAPVPTVERWTFVDEAASPTDLGFVTHGSAKSGAWVVEPHDLATGGRALANREGERGAGPAVIVAPGQSQSRDLRLSTRCMIEATPHGACGVVFRFVDAKNHWIVRADAKSNAIEVVTVNRGVESVIGKASPPSGVLAIGNWIDLAIEVRGDVVRVAIGARPVLTAETALVPARFGSAGLWAPSESKAVFDHLAIETLAPVPRAIEILPLLGRASG